MIIEVHIKNNERSICHQLYSSSSIGLFDKIVNTDLLVRRINIVANHIAEEKTIKDYEDIIFLPHHVSKKRAKMAIKDRAAQFAQFATVVGHKVAIKETARYIDKRKELYEMEKAIIDEKLREINSWLPEENEVEIVYFKPDTSKIG